MEFTKYINEKLLRPGFQVQEAIPLEGGELALTIVGSDPGQPEETHHHTLMLFEVEGVKRSMRGEHNGERG